MWLCPPEARAPGKPHFDHSPPAAPGPLPPGQWRSRGIELETRLTKDWPANNHSMSQDGDKGERSGGSDSRSDSPALTARWSADPASSPAVPEPRMALLVLGSVSPVTHASLRHGHCRETG